MTDESDPADSDEENDDVGKIDKIIDVALELLGLI